jgi:hypothetical protein
MNSNVNTKVPIIVAVVLVLILLIAGLGLYKNNTQTAINNYPTPSQEMSYTPTAMAETVTPIETRTPSGMIEKTITVDLMAVAPTNTSQKGTATLKEQNGKVIVSIDVTGMTTSDLQPAHIHMGACPKPGSVVFPLSNVVNGKSETTLNTTIADLKTKLPLAINIHKSQTEQGVYTSCGDIHIQ